MRYACSAISFLLMLPVVALPQECGDYGAMESLQVGYQSISSWLTALDATDEDLCFAGLDESAGRPAHYCCRLVR